MDILALKLILAPLIIGTASLAGRRWGTAVSGWIVGMPLTTGPVVFFVALSHGAEFAERSALGVLSGGFSLVLYAVTYAWLARALPWPAALGGGLAFFAASTLLLEGASFPLVPLFLSVTAAILLGLRLMPPESHVEPERGQPGRWDIPMRILIGTSFILLLTGSASVIGARLTGLLATFPLYISIMAVFSQRLEGPGGPAHMLRGLLYGMFAFVAFFLTLGLLLEPFGTGLAFATAALAALAVQGVSLLILRNNHPGP